MTLVVTESIESRSIVALQGSVYGRRLFHVYDDGGAQVDPEDVIALYGTSLPGDYEVFPGMGGLYRTSVPMLKRMDGGDRSLWVNEHEYIATSSPPNANDKLPGEPDYVSVDSETQSYDMELYRQLDFIDLPPGGNVTSPGSDIGGTGVDVAGVPSLAFRFCERIHIVETLDIDPLDAVQLVDPGLFVGKRNQSPFLGRPIGSMVYEGQRLATVGFKRVQLAHTMLCDSRWLHLLQIPERHGNGPRVGEPQIDPSTGRVKYVYFRQPYSDLVEFHDLSNNF